jgi:uncharacterized protein (TIGR02147 family)
MWREQFKTILKEEFEKKKADQPDFSLNKFAKLAGVSAGTMSELFNGRRDWNLTEDRAAEIIHRLPVSKTKKNKILVSLGKKVESPKEVIATDNYEFFLNWKLGALIMALDLPLKQRTPEILCRRFELVPEELQRLLDVGRAQGLIDIDGQGNYQRKPKFWTSSDNIPNEVVRQLQVNSTQLVVDSIQNVPKEKRDCTSMTFVGSRERLDDVRKELRAIYERVNALMATENDNDEVFQLSVSLIPLSRNTNEDL